MTYQRRWGIVVVMALGPLAGCTSQHDYETGSSSGGGTSGSSSSAGSSSSGGTDAVCGDGVKDGEEQCDGSDLGGATCASIKGAGYFAPPGKALACRPDCTLDASACTNACILDAPGSQLDSCVLQ